MDTETTKTDDRDKVAYEFPDKPPPYTESKGDSLYARKASQNSFVSVDLDSQENVYNVGYDQNNVIQNSDSLTAQYDDNFYQPALQRYTNLGQIRTELNVHAQSARQNAYDKWFNGGLRGSAHIKVHHPSTLSGPPLDQYHAGYDQPLTQIPTFTSNFNVGFSQHRIKDSTSRTTDQPKPAFFKPDKPYSMLIPAFFACICCLPTGICAILAAINAKKAYETGDLVSAQMYTTKTQRLTLASIVIGIMWVTVIIVVLTTKTDMNHS